MKTEPIRFTNRELSWLEFNQRVLDEAKDVRIPLLERLKFLAITASNLDEFFMVRVGGLELLAAQKSRKLDPSGRTAEQQLAAIGERTHRMTTDQYECYSKHLEPALEDANFRRVRADQLSDRQVKTVAEIFESVVYPVLTPAAVTSTDDFPLLINQTLNLCVQLAPTNDESEEPRFAIIPIGRSMDRQITLPSEGGYQYALIEDIIELHISRFFPGETIVETVPFRITRNADLAIEQDSVADLLREMESILDARKQSHCVRLEIADRASGVTRSFLQNVLELGDTGVFPVSGPIDLASMMRLTEVKGFDPIRYEPWKPQPSPAVDAAASMFENLANQDILLCHPFESFEPVVRFLEEAADDPDVLAIKQILYRTSRESPIVAALQRAAVNGKQVTVILELKARFDEARNIEWARNLEQAGVQVIYGIRGLKTHAKICIVVRREPQGIQRYVHFGTGNYNETTARLYTDISYMTCDEQLGADATNFFNTITGYSQPQRFRKIEAAPIGLRDKIIQLIENETERKRQGQRAHIMAKMNSCVDPQVIEALYKASQAGVVVELNVRGICCLRPGVPGLSDNISVISIIDRYLEHSRIFYFHHGGDEQVYIASADWMQRNLDRRIELFVPVENPAARAQLIHILKTCLSDNVKGRRLLEDGSYEEPSGEIGLTAARSQEILYREACESKQRALRATGTVFVPERAQSAPVERTTRTQRVPQQATMKTLLILRHAKSSWKENGLADHERPLAKRGKNDAPTIGRLLYRKGLVPELIVSSTAKRARKTAKIVAENCGYRRDIILSDDLYLAPPAAYAELLQQLPDNVDRIMFVGHNPGMSDLLYALTGVEEDLPTAALAQIELDVSRWRDMVLETKGELIDLWRPRDLK